MKKIYLPFLFVLLSVAFSHSQSLSSSGNWFTPLCPGETRTLTITGTYSLSPLYPGGPQSYTGTIPSSYDYYIINYNWNVNGVGFSTGTTSFFSSTFSAASNITGYGLFFFYKKGGGGAPDAIVGYVTVNSVTNLQISAYQITDLALPQHQTISEPSTLNPGQSATYSVPSTCDHYSWSFSGLGNIIGIAQNINFTAPQISGNYTLQVTTYNDVCTSYKITDTKAITVNNTPPTVPTGFGSYPINNGSTQLFWVKSQDNESVILYDTQPVDANGNPNGSPTHLTSGSDNGYVFNYPGIWRFKLSAVDNKGLSSGLSNAIYFINDQDPPTTPTSLSYSYDSDQLKYTINWAVSTDAISGLAGYKLYHNNVLFVNSNGSTTISGNSIAIHNYELGDNLNHVFSVTGFDNLGNESTKSSPISFYRDGFAPVTPGLYPNPISVTGMTSNSVSIAWLATNDNSGIAPNYKLYKNKVFVTSISGTSYTLGAISENDVFTLSLTAFDNSGNESSSSDLNVTIDVTPPTAPSNLTVAGKSFKNINLTWTASFDLHMKGYYVFKDGNKLTPNPVTSNSYSGPGAPDIYGSNYYVQAVDMNNNLSGFSSPVFARPAILVVDTARLSVGIGRDTPLERLHVDGNIRIENGSLLFNGKDAANNNIGQMAGSLYIQSASTTTGNTLLNLYGGNVGIGTATPSVALDVKGSIKVSGTISVNTITAQNLFSTLLGSSLANISTLAGNYLTVTGIKAGNLSSAIISVSTLASDVIASNQLSVTGLAQLGLISVTNNTINTPSSLLIQNQATGFQNTILNQSGGSVGIGVTPNPSFKLDVNGTIQATGIKVGNGSLISNLTSSQWVTSGNDISYATGNVNITNGNIKASGIQLGSGAVITNLTSSQWTTLNTNIYYTGGNVGIGSGITAPSQALEVGGNIKANGKITVYANRTDLLRLQSSTKGLGNTAGIDFATGTGTGVGARIAAAASDANNYNADLVFYTNGNSLANDANPTEQLRIQANGVVAVKNRIDATEVKVCVSPGNCPDYVFEKDYKLMSLEKTEQYIKENKHLPEIDAATSIEANGLNLKEMNLTLLKKVEEITLHLIEMEKTNKKLEKRIRELESR